MSTQKGPKRKKLNLSVKREMQFRMIGRIFALLFISLLLSSLIFYLFANREVTASYQMFHVKARNFLDFLLPAVVGAFFISLIVGWIGSLFFPRSIAGGIYRIEQDLKQVIEQGDLTKQIKLREGDQVMSLAAGVNALLENYRRRIGRIDQALERLEKATHGAGTDHGKVAVRQACEDLRTELRGLKY